MARYTAQGMARKFRERDERVRQARLDAAQREREAAVPVVPAHTHGPDWAHGVTGTTPRSNAGHS